MHLGFARIGSSGKFEQSLDVGQSLAPLVPLLRRQRLNASLHTSSAQQGKQAKFATGG